MDIRWFQTASILMGIEHLPGHWIVLLCKISLGEDIFGLIGVDCRSRSRSSKEAGAEGGTEHLDLQLYKAI